MRSIAGRSWSPRPALHPRARARGPPEDAREAVPVALRTGTESPAALGCTGPSLFRPSRTRRSAGPRFAGPAQSPSGLARTRRTRAGRSPHGPAEPKQARSPRPVAGASALEKAAGSSGERSVCPIAGSRGPGGSRSGAAEGRGRGGRPASEPFANATAAPCRVRTRSAAGGSVRRRRVRGEAEPGRTVRSTTRSSNSAKLAPRQRRTPPPNGIQAARAASFEEALGAEPLGLRVDAGSRWTR